MRKMQPIKLLLPGNSTAPKNMFSHVGSVSCSHFIMVRIERSEEILAKAKNNKVVIIQ